jgi:hypothetical protein
MRYYQGPGKRPAAKVGQNFDQRSTRQVSANSKKWSLNQAETGEGSGFVGLHAIDVQRTWQLKCRAFHVSPVLRPAGAPRPFLPAVAQKVLERAYVFLKWLKGRVCRSAPRKAIFAGRWWSCAGKLQSSDRPRQNTSNRPCCQHHCVSLH